MRHGIVIVLWTLALFTLAMATVPHPPALPGVPSGQAEHILAFATLTALAMIAYPRARVVTVFAWLAGFGAMIEVIQAIPLLHRDPDMLDWITDCCTILFVLCLR